MKLMQFLFAQDLFDIEADKRKYLRIAVYEDTKFCNQHCTILFPAMILYIPLTLKIIVIDLYLNLFYYIKNQCNV